MSTVPHFPLYCPDWIQDTAFMSHEAKGLFIDLLCYCWLHEGLPTDERELAKLARMDLRKFKRVWNEIKHKFVRTSPELIENLGPQVSEKSAVLLKDFSNRSLRYWNPRLLKEMLQLAERQEKKRLAGQKGGLSKARNLLGQKTKQKPSISYPYPYPYKKDIRSSDDEHVSRFDEFWDIQIRKSGKKKCMQTWKSRKLDKIADKILTAYRNQKREMFQFRDKDKTPLPLTWLNGDRWLDEIVSERPETKLKGNIKFGNGEYNQPPPRAQPPDASKLSNDHNRPLTEKEKQVFKRMVAQAKEKIKPNGGQQKPEVTQHEDKQPEHQPTMAKLLFAAKSCYAAWDGMGEPCGTEWHMAFDDKKNKCHWCEKFERQRNGPAKKDSTKTLGDLM